MEKYTLIRMWNLLQFKQSKAVLFMILILSFTFFCLLAVLLLHPSYGSKALSCCPWVYPPVSSKHGWLFLIPFLNVANWSFCVPVCLDSHLHLMRSLRWYWERRLQHPSSPFLTFLNRSVMQFKQEQDKVTLIWKIMQSCILLSTKSIDIPFLGTRQESWSHFYFQRDHREYSWSLRSVKCDELIL